jgi:hypothetical protein
MKTQVLIAALAVLAGACASSRGYQESEGLAEDIQGTAAAVDAYGANRERSFASMNELVNAPHVDMAVKFETFSRCVDRVRSSERTLRNALSTMKASGDKRFQEWGQRNAAFTDHGMRIQSEQNCAAASASVRRAGEDTEAMLSTSTGFVAYLSELRNLLANDLSENSVASVSGFAAKARVANGELDGMARLTIKSLEAASDAMSSKTYPK